MKKNHNINSNADFLVINFNNFQTTTSPSRGNTQITQSIIAEVIPKFFHLITLTIGRKDYKS
jgi:hypothetical protein